MNTQFSRAASLTLAVVTMSCGYHPFDMEVEVVIPQLPSELAECIEPRVLLQVDSDGAGGMDINLSAGDVRKLKLPKADVTVFTAWYEGGVPPAGAVMPCDGRDDNRLELSFAQGFCSAVYTHLADAGMPLSVINYRRLKNECLLRSGGNPFLLDQDRIYRSLLAGNFSIHDIVMLYEYQLPSDALPCGIWTPANPLAPDLVCGEEALVYQGRWTYYNQGKAAVLWCDSMGWNFYEKDGGFSRSGLW